MTKKKNLPKTEAKQNKPMVLSNELRAETSLMLNNNMADVLGIGSGGDIGCDFFSQLSQLDTLYKNQRWGLISNQRQLVSQMFVEHGLVRTVIEVPADDAFRGGLDITTKQLNEEQIKKLQTVLETKDDIGKYCQAVKWKRLYGGAAVILITDQDPSLPLNLKELEGDKFTNFLPVDMWELNNPTFHTEDRKLRPDHDEDDVDDTDDTLTPTSSEDSVPVEKLSFTTRKGCFDYYGQKVHKSRLRIMKGVEAPSFLRPRLRGWALSELEDLVRSINQFLKSTNLTFEVLDEFKLDIFKIKGLKDYMLSTKGQAAIAARVAMANQQKNYQNALTMDSEDDHLSKQLSFTGLAEVMTGIRLQVACDMRMPLTKIFGMSAAGFNSGEDDIENYNSMVESRIRSKSKPDLLWMVKIRCKQLFGIIPSDLSIAYKPLRVLSSIDEESVKDKKHARLIATQAAGLMSVQEFKEACNKAELLPTKLDVTLDKLDVLGEEMNEDSPDMANRPSQIAMKEDKAFAHEKGLSKSGLIEKDEKPKLALANSFDESKHPIVRLKTLVQQ